MQWKREEQRRDKKSVSPFGTAWELLFSFFFLLSSFTRCTRQIFLIWLGWDICAPFKRHRSWNPASPKRIFNPQSRFFFPPHTRAGCRPDLFFFGHVPILSPPPSPTHARSVPKVRGGRRVHVEHNISLPSGVTRTRTRPFFRGGGEDP